MTNAAHNHPISGTWTHLGAWPYGYMDTHTHLGAWVHGHTHPSRGRRYMDTPTHLWDAGTWTHPPIWGRGYIDTYPSQGCGYICIHPRTWNTPTLSQTAHFSYHLKESVTESGDDAFGGVVHR
jgi:hypothetical protein